MFMRHLDSQRLKLHEKLKLTQRILSFFSRKLLVIVWITNQYTWYQILLELILILEQNSSHMCFNTNRFQGKKVLKETNIAAPAMTMIMFTQWFKALPSNTNTKILCKRN